MIDGSTIISKLQQAKSDPEKTWIITDLVLQNMSPDLKEAFLAAAVPHWFDPNILAALLSIQTTDAIDLYEIMIKKFNFTERFGSLGYALQDLTRNCILWYLINHQLNRLQTYSKCAWKYFNQFDNDPQNAVETTYHLIITNSSFGLNRFKEQLADYKQQYNFSAVNNLMNNGKELIRLGLLSDNLPEFIVDDVNSNQPRLETAHIERTPLTIEPTKMHDGKTVIRYFVSYAHDDNDLKDKLLKPLKQQLKIAKDYRFEAWDDGEILAGERWHEQIQAAVARCQFGLLLVSPAFLGSAYIQDHELQAFVASNLAVLEPEKRAIPVALRPIPFNNSIDLKGLEQLQIFRDSAERAFEERGTRKTRNDFASELFQQILKIVKRYGAHPHLTESETYGGAGRNDDQGHTS